MEDLVKDCIRDYNHVPRLEFEWNYWKDQVAPQSDDSAAYCNLRGLEIPFNDELFLKSGLNCETAIAPHIRKDKPITKGARETLNSVIWDNRGHPCE